jgi:benzil reductase ((S)-benzoin forming)
MNIYIVTGTTRGLGRALAEVIMAEQDFLLSLSRAPDGFALRNHNVRCDLRQVDKISGGLERLLDSVDLAAARAIVLINNAGVLEPMGPAETLVPGQLLEHLMINQAAPALLMSAFLRLTTGFEGPRRVINISSGAGKHPYPGWSMYCATKAALDMMTRCVAAEQQGRDHPVAICAVSPGKMETDMQARIRALDTQIFPARDDFVKAWLHGELIHPKAAARMILALDKSGALKNGGVYDLRREWTSREGTF